MSQEPQQTPEQAQEDALLAHPVVVRRRAQWQRLTETWQPLSAEETAALMDWMRQEAHRQKRWRRGMRLLLTCFAGGFAGLSLGEYFWRWNVAGFIGLINLFSVINLTLMLAWNSDAHKKKLAALNSLSDVHLVGPLCEIATSGNRDLRALSQDALIRLLPRMQESDTVHLTGEQRNCLYSLMYARNVKLVRAILKSLERIGDGKALPYVQNLANGKYLAANDLRVRVIADCCLPALEERARQEQVSGTLLRPAGADSGDILLRATTGVSDTPRQQLLRATQNSHREDQDIDIG